MDIGVIGGGSLGLLLTYYLSKNHDITLYVRRISQLETIKSSGLQLKKDGQLIESVYVHVELIEDLSNKDLIFITVKQPQIDLIIDHLQNKEIQSHVVFLQNGMGHIDKIASLSLPVSIGVVEHGANRTADHEVNHLGAGRIKLAPFNYAYDKLVCLYSLLHDIDFPFDITEKWLPLVKNKLLINAVINPLTALFDVPNGAIITNESLRELAKQLTKEAANVLRLNEQDAWNEVKRVALNTKFNTSSMRADIIKNRETENKAISGYLLKKANDVGTPYTSFIYHAIQALEERGRK